MNKDREIRSKRDERNKDRMKKIGENKEKEINENK
jgi:hypothetical protein